MLAPEIRTFFIVCSPPVVFRVGNTLRGTADRRLTERSQPLTGPDSGYGLTPTPAYGIALISGLGEKSPSPSGRHDGQPTSPGSTRSKPSKNRSTSSWV